MNIQNIKNVSDCVPLYLPHSLYLKPSAKLNVSVQLPAAVPGKTISNWDVMESLRKMIKPDEFQVLKATKSTLEVIRFDAELEDRTRLKGAIARLDGNSIKLAGYSEAARVRASEAKDNFPKRHDWDSYFRDARNMDEKKPGERPDTIYFSNLPIRWFCPRHMESDDDVKPSENIFRRIFEKFGSVRAVDIPICDTFRKDMKSHMTGLKMYSFDQDVYFEGFVQFSEYLGFVKAMDEFRGMKLVRKEGEKNLAVNIIVDFDTTKHLSETSIKRRQFVRDRLIQKEQQKREEELKVQKEEELKTEKERQRLENLKLEEFEKQRMREERRKEKHLKKLREQEKHQLTSKIQNEEKKLLIAQRKLESIRVLEAVFERIKLKNEAKKLKKVHGKNDAKKVSSLTHKLISKMKSVHEEKLERQKKRMRDYNDAAFLGKALESKDRSPSVNTISSDENILSDHSMEKKPRSDDPPERDEIPYSMYGREGEPWMNMPIGVYPYPTFFPAHMFPGPPMNFPSRGRFRGRFGRSRGSYRGRYNHSFENRNDYDDYDSRDYNRSRYYNKRSRSRSRSRSYSSRSRSKSRSRSRSRRNRSRKGRSTSANHSKLNVENKARNLASTLRDFRSSSGGSSDRSRRRTSKKNNRRKGDRRKNSHHRSSSRSRSRNRSRSRERSKSRSKTRNKSHSRSQSRKKSTRKRTPSPSHTPKRKSHSKSKSRDRSPEKPRSRTHSRSRSASVDSSEFKPPQRKAKSSSPENK